MAQDNYSLPQYFGQHVQSGTPADSPGGPPPGVLSPGILSPGGPSPVGPSPFGPSPVAPQYDRGSDDSRQELLRLPIHSQSAQIDAAQEPNPPNSSGGPPTITPKSSNVRRTVGPADLNEYPSTGRVYTSHEENPGRLRKPSRDFRAGPMSVSHYRPTYFEEDDEYWDEEEDPRMYRRRYTRQHRRPPVAYESYQDFNAQNGPPPSRARGSVDPYYETPTKPQYHMHYGSDDEDRYKPQRPTMPGASDGKGPPSPPVTAEAALRLPWAVWMGSNAKNRKPFSTSTFTKYVVLTD